MPQNKHETELAYRQQPFYRKPVFFLILAVLIAGGVFAGLYFSKKPAEPTQEESSESNDSKSKTDKNEKTDNKTKEDTSSSSETPTSSTSPDNKTPAQYEGNDPNLGDSLTGFLSTARFDGDKLVVRVSIDQYLSSGTCALTLSDASGNHLEKTARLIPNASTSTCEGFDIAGSETANLSRPINIEINLTSGDRTGTIKGNIE